MYFVSASPSVKWKKKTYGTEQQQNSYQPLYIIHAKYKQTHAHTPSSKKYFSISVGLIKTFL